MAHDFARIRTAQSEYQAIKGKIRSALFYPVAILVVAFIVTAVIMVWMVLAFKSVFSSFGAELPMPTQIVIWLSDQFVAYWYGVVGVVAVSSSLFSRA